MKILIKDGWLINPKTGMNGIADVLINSGIIADLGTDLDSKGCEVINAKGLHVIPGLVDAHCHLRDPGYEYKEDIETGTRSAAAGGFTSIACMPNTNPVIDNKAVVSYIMTKAKQEGSVNVFPIGAISKGLKGEELAEIGELKFAGAVAISDDGRPVKNGSLMKKAMQYASMFDIAVISHCEDQDLSEDGMMNEGYMSTILGLRGIPSAAEEVMVARELILSEYTGMPIHIAHVSTALSVDLIRNAKKRGVRVTAETCPHYFSLTDKACEGFNTLAKVNPPLRGERDVAAIIEGLRDDTLDIIATDHAPHHEDEKNIEFELAANGIIGFETAFSLAYTHLVKTGILSLNDIVSKMSLKPSNLLGLNKGSIELGKAADITIIDSQAEYTVDLSEFQSKARNSPFGGHRLSGSVNYTIVGGKIVLYQKALM